MTGFIEPNAVNLLDFQCKPIRGHAGGKITTGEIEIENSHCFQVRANICAFIRLSVILSMWTTVIGQGVPKQWCLASCYHWSWRVIYICVMYFEADRAYSLFSPGNLENGIRRHSHLQNNLVLYKHFLNRRVLAVCRHLYTAIGTSWQLHACQTQMFSHVIMLTKM